MGGRHDPVRPLPNLIDQVYARILEAIIDRTLPPGQRIRQNELADKLGVSRQPVSHALHLSAPAGTRFRKRPPRL
jgi:DNA-binding GntR family transcriptional regulator